MTEAVIGLDIGTTSVKAVAMSDDGRVLGRANSTPLQMRGDEPGWATQDPTDLIKATFQALAGVMAASLTGTRTDSLRFVAMSIAAQSGSVVGLDSNDVPVTELITWMDTRAADIVDRWGADGTAVRIRELSGWSAGCGLGLSTIASLTETGHIDRDGIVRFTSADDLVVHALTGQWRTNPSNAAGMQLMDLASAEWSDELCVFAGIDKSMLSELVPTGSVVGPLTDEARERLGVAVGDLVVVLGGHDQSCAALALGITEPGQCLLATGTAWVLTTVTSAGGLEDVPRSMSISRHVVPGRFTASQYLGGFGASMRWWADTCAEVEGSPVTMKSLDCEAAAAIATGLSTGPRPTFRVTGIDGSGLAAPGAGVFVGNADPAPRSRRTLAVMDAGATAAATALGKLDQVTSLTMIGGTTAGTSWPRIVASAAERPVTVVDEESLPGLGAATIAAASVDMFPNAGSAIAATNTDSAVVEPGTEPQA